jgi:hypothetical protein
MHLITQALTALRQKVANFRQQCSQFLEIAIRRIADNYVAAYFRIPQRFGNIEEKSPLQQAALLAGQKWLKPCLCFARNRDSGEEYYGIIVRHYADSLTSGRNIGMMLRSGFMESPYAGRKVGALSCQTLQQSREQQGCVKTWPLTA